MIAITTGNWSVVRHSYLVDGEPVCHVGNYTVVTDGELNGDDGKSDSQAIAALPDVIEALETVYEALEGRYDGAPDSPTRWMGQSLEVVCLALKKAGAL